MLGAVYGVLALSLIILPGICYRTGREIKHRARLLQGFRETALLIFPGIVATFAGLVVFALIRWCTPEHTPDVGMFLREPGDYFRTHAPYLMGWIAGIELIACLGALLVGMAITRFLAGNRMIPRSAWSNRFFEKPGDDSFICHVQCHLVDGAVISGTLFTFNEDLEETQDRDICIEDPVYRMSMTAQESLEWDSGLFPSYAIVSAANIRFIVVTELIVGYNDGPVPLSVGDNPAIGG